MRMMNLIAVAAAVFVSACQSSKPITDNPAVERAADVAVQGAVAVLEHAPVPTLRRQANNAAIVRALPALSDDWRWLAEQLVIDRLAVDHAVLPAGVSGVAAGLDVRELPLCRTLGELYARPRRCRLYGD